MKIDHENVERLIEDMEFVYQPGPDGGFDEEATRDLLMRALLALTLETGMP